MSKFYVAGNNILLPNIIPQSYDTLGWNWFNFETREWNSCAFTTKEDAIRSYQGTYNVRKVDVKLTYSDFDFEIPEQHNNTTVLDEELFKI